MISLNEFFQHDITLENERVKLSRLKREDFSALETIAYEPQLWALGMGKIQGSEQLHTYLDTALTEMLAKTCYPFIIYDKQMELLAGCTRFASISIPNKRVEIGWTWIHPRHQGTGLNKACKFLLLQFAFEILKVNRVELKTDVLNLQSRKAILKIGAKEEGIFRKHQVTATGRVRDSIFFSIINDEWLQIKGNIFPEYI